MDEERRALVSARLAKAARKLAAARADIEAARWDEAASRAYYAMFHAARALLAARGVSARTHAGLAAVFADEFIRTKELDPDLGRWLGQGRRARELGDYDDFLSLDAQEAKEAVSRATRFLDEARRWLTARGFAVES